MDLSGFEGITTEALADPAVLEKLLIPLIFQNRYEIPGVEITEEGGKKIVTIDGPEVFESEIDKIIADGKNSIIEVLQGLAAISPSGAPISGTGYTMCVVVKSLLDKFTTATNIEIVHVEGESTPNKPGEKPRPQTTFGLVYTVNGERKFSSITFTTPISQTSILKEAPKKGEEDKYWTDKSPEFSNTCRLDLNNPDYFTKHYASSPGESPLVRFYEKDGKWFLDLILGADCNDVFMNQKLTPVKNDEVEKIIIKSFRNLLSATRNIRIGNVVLDKDGKFVLQSADMTPDNIKKLPNKKAASLEDMREATKVEGEYDIRVKRAA